MTIQDDPLDPAALEATIDAGMPQGTPHGLFEDGYALVVGTILLSMGLVLLQKAELATGGVAGIALTLNYLTGVPLGLIYALLSLPMLALTVRAMGRAFLVKTVIVTLGLFGLTMLAPHVLVIDHVARPVAAIVGGTLLGMGVLALARHAAGSGGSGAVILALYRTRGWNAGRTQMLVDTCVLLFSLLALSLEQVLWSLVGAAFTGSILFLWHRPGRYTGY